MLHTATLLCLTLMTGNEFCVAAFINPVLRQLAESQQIPFLSRAASRLGRAMPFWYAASLLLTIANAFMLHCQTGSWPLLVVICVGLQLVILAITLGLMVPINNKLGGLQVADTGWTPMARRWDRLHQLRVILLLNAVIALVE